MALGRRKGEVQQDLFITADQLPKSIGHVFYRKLNELLAEAGFDRWVEDLCGPYYSQGKGRPGIPPGVYFRMLIGFFREFGDADPGLVTWRVFSQVVRQPHGFGTTWSLPSPLVGDD